MQIDNRLARHLILDLQGLTRPHHKALPKGGLREVIQKLGLVQVDTIQWMERAHHMILAARSQCYRPSHLKRLAEREQCLFEHWTHDASFLPVEQFPYWKHRFERERVRLDKKFETWQGEGYRDHLKIIRQRIGVEGRLKSRDIEVVGDRPKEMWQWHDGKAALEYLWRTGEIGIIGREGFQKVYAPMEDCIPQGLFNAEVSEAEFVEWAVMSAIARLGFGSAGDIARYWDLLRPAEVKSWLEGAGRDRLIPVEVIGIDGVSRSALARPDIQECLEELDDPPLRLRALSPFDPVIRDRKRLEWLYGYDYRIEIYVPAEKRRWGYYIFPLLDGHRLIGRVDMRCLRDERAISVKRVWLEKGVRFSKALEDRLEGELVRQCRLCGVDSYRFEDGWDEGR